MFWELCFNTYCGRKCQKEHHINPECFHCLIFGTASSYLKFNSQILCCCKPESYDLFIHKFLNVYGSMFMFAIPLLLIITHRVLISNSAICGYEVTRKREKSTLDMKSYICKKCTAGILPSARKCRFLYIFAHCYSTMWSNLFS